MPLPALQEPVLSLLAGLAVLRGYPAPATG